MKSHTSCTTTFQKFDNVFFFKVSFTLGQYQRLQILLQLFDFINTNIRNFLGYNIIVIFLKLLNMQVKFYFHHFEANM